MKFNIVSESKKEQLRNLFIEKFVNTKTNHYAKYIETLKEYSDGMCYDGYLWDSLKAEYNKREKTMEEALQYLRNMNNVFVMWDIHSKERVFDKKVLKERYPKDTIIEIDAKELSQYIQNEWGDHGYITNQSYLPEDIYIFNSSMEWYVIFTHEGYDHYMKPQLDENDYIRICFVYEGL